jgi:hypothetical protein
MFSSLIMNKFFLTAYCGKVNLMLLSKGNFAFMFEVFTKRNHKKNPSCFHKTD